MHPHDDFVAVAGIFTGDEPGRWGQCLFDPGRLEVRAEPDTAAVVGDLEGRIVAQVGEPDLPVDADLDVPGLGLDDLLA